MTLCYGLRHYETYGGVKWRFEALRDIVLQSEALRDIRWRKVAF